jgi:hypothetical protein
MRRLVVLCAAASVAAVPAVIGLAGNPSFSHTVPVSVPSQAKVANTTVHDAGDDRLAKSVSPSPSATQIPSAIPSTTSSAATTAVPGTTSDDRATSGREAEPGDDRGLASEPGDDRGVHAEPGDDRSASATSATAGTTAQRWSRLRRLGVRRLQRQGRFRWFRRLR